MLPKDIDHEIEDSIIIHYLQKSHRQKIHPLTVPNLWKFDGQRF